MNVFKSNSAGFFRKNAALKDVAMGHMAMDIEVALKTSSGMPVKTGGMKSETRHFRNSNNVFRVEIDKVYAAVQEKGMIKGSPIRNYTTSGTSSGFFKRAIDGVLRHKMTYIEEAKRAVGLS